MQQKIENYGITKGFLNFILRLEGLAVFLTMIFVYKNVAINTWSNFFYLFFIPDIGFLGYFLNKKFGSISYNITHTYLSPLILLAFLYFKELNEYVFLVVIWVAHIGFDRALGFGLKYKDGFKFTHLGFLGKKSKTNESI